MNNDFNKLFAEEPAHQRSAKLRRNITAYLRRWPIFLLSILFFLFLAWLYTRYLVPIYQSNIKVLIKESESQNGANILLSDVAVQGGINGGVDNEIEIMTSRRLLQQVIDNLNVANTYMVEGKILDTELYGDELPILVKSFTPDSISKNMTISVNYNLPNINIKYGDKEVKTKINQPFKIGNQNLVFFNNPLGSKKKKGEFYVEIRDRIAKSKTLQSKLKIELAKNNSSAISLVLNGPTPSKNEDILTELIRVYNVDAKNDKSVEFEKTEEFIEERIAILNDELSGVEGEKENFQQSNDIASLPEEISSSIAEKDQVENDLLQIDTELSLVNTYKGYVNNQPISEVLPSDVSNSGGNTNSAVSTYNELVVQRNNLMANGATSNHPMVKTLESNISSAKQNILTNINKQQQVLQSTRRNLSSKLSSASGFKKQAPKLARIARDIDRQQQIKESLYLLLLEKREEAAISKAITEDKIKIIDPASTKGPVSPVKTNYYFAALALGLLLPLAIIYSKELLKNKLETRDDLEELINDEPIVGEIPRVNLDNEKYSVVGGDLSALSEAFRILRTNLEFVLSKVEKPDTKGTVILVTSSIKGEGKTFISMNYAHTLGQLKGRKTIIIGSDIRNPQLHRYENIDKSIKGLTEYLYNDGDDYRQYVHTSKADGRTDILFSGRIPPNPTEMLMSIRFEELINELREVYDYIVIDSAPLVLVSDTFHISKLADATLYVTRSEYTPKNVLRIPLDAEQQNRIKNLTFVINDISTSHSGYAYGYKYNYGYGYGYGEKNRKRSFGEKFLSSFGININK